MVNDGAHRTDGGAAWDSVLISKVMTSGDESDGVGSLGGFRVSCWGFAGWGGGRGRNTDKTEVLVLNSSSMLLLEAKEGSTKFKVRRRRLLHQVDVVRGATPETLVIWRAVGEERVSQERARYDGRDTDERGEGVLGHERGQRDDRADRADRADRVDRVEKGRERERDEDGRGKGWEGTREKNRTANNGAWSALTIRFLSEQEATRVYDRMNKTRNKFQAALELLDFPGAKVAPLDPRVYQVIVDDRIVARHPASNVDMKIKALSRQSKVGFIAESPMGVVCGYVRGKELLKGSGKPHTLLLLPEGGDSKDDDSKGDDSKGDDKHDDDKDGVGRFAVEVRLEAKVSRWRLGLFLAAAAVVAFLSYATYEVLQPEGTSAFLLLAAMLVVRILVAAMHHDVLLKVTSCTVVEQQPTSSTIAKRGDVSSFSRCLSVDHCLSLRRSLVDGLDMSDDQIESEMVAETLERLHEMSPAMNDDLFQRYVGACKGDVTKALSRLEDTAKWRQENSVDDILNANLPHFFTLKKHYLHALIGRTRDGLPIIVEGMGRFGKAVTAFRKEGILPDHADEIIKQFIFHMEYIFKVVDPSAYPRGKFLRIYDMMGISLRDVGDSEAVNLGYEMMTMLENHYCERMARAIVIAPPIFSTLWHMFSGLVDPATVEKIKIVSPRKLLAALREEMDDDVIPRRWGGQGVNDWYESDMERDMAAWVRQRQT